MNWENFSTLAYKIMTLAYINLLWILFSIVGLGILGLFPATTAMYAITRKLIIGETNFNIFSVFWGNFKKDFLKANGFGLITAITVYILYFDFMFVVQKNDFQFLLPIFLFILIAFLATLIFLFPVYTHFNLRFYQYIRQSFFIAITSPIELVLISASAIVIYFLLTLFPGAIPLFSGSIFAYISTFLSFRAFERIEKKKKTQFLKSTNELR
ncbi:YesL family protein [Psychrobacillus sp. NPDC096623]|uniref:YesL family protein n=1 Tax=Psychrobacillus sp. NPDC096623 TaxID=3364492 RepID=UPI003805C98F